MAADPQAQDTLRQSHQVAQAALASAHGVVQNAAAKAQAPPQAHPEIMGALQQILAQQGQGQQGPPQGTPPGMPGGGMPDPATFVQQDPAAAAQYADGILDALSQMIMSMGMPSQSSAEPGPGPEVGGENLGY